MASDILLVLKSDHRTLGLLADRCTRPARGFADPRRDLERALSAHLAATSTEVYPRVRRDGPGILPEALATADARRLIALAEDVRSYEESEVLPALEALLIEDRRRIGKVYRIRRDVALRSFGTSRRRPPSQPELYELARRAGVEQRSRMTAAQLHAAVLAAAHPDRERFPRTSDRTPAGE
jgi:hypothetical protein